MSTRAEKVRAQAAAWAGVTKSAARRHLIGSKELEHILDCEEKLAALAWQPIATAPKDGRWILLWWIAEKRAVIGRWTNYQDQSLWRFEGDNFSPQHQHDCILWAPLLDAPKEEKS